MMHDARYSTAGRRLKGEEEADKKNSTKDKQRDHLREK